MIRAGTNAAVLLVLLLALPVAGSVALGVDAARAHSGYSIRGQVLAAPDSTPIEAAAVMLAGARGAVTTPSGEFFLFRLPAGVHSIEVRARGFTTRHLEVALGETTPEANVQVVLHPVGH